MSEEHVLETRHLKRYFGRVHAVEDVSLRVRKGEIFGFLGLNGAGKTTTISMILGLMYPTAGEVEIFGERVTPLHNRVLRRVGTMVGAAALMQPFSARENLKCMSYLRPDLPSSRIDEALERVGLQHDANRPVRTFSTGMRQRLGLALALLNRPQLLVLDEPTNGMDPAGMHEVRTLLRTLAKEEHITIFLSSHLLHEMEILCDRVAVINKGRVVAEGAVDELLKYNDTIQVQSADPERTAALLSQLPEAHHIQTNGNYVQVQGVSSEQGLHYLVQQGVTPREVSTVRPDLESFFLELTQKGA